MEPNQEHVDGDALKALHKALKASPENCAALGILLETPERDPGKLLDAVNENLVKLYDAHVAGQHHLLQTLFADLDEQKTADLRRLRILEKAITKFFGVAPKTFGNLENSRTDLGACSIAFVDFFLEGVGNHEEARKHHQAVKAELGANVKIGEDSFPKVVVLMSTSLPGPSDLALFRKDTGVRGSFFHTMDKATFSAPEIETRLTGFKASYDLAKQLNGYLETIEREISSVAAELTTELRSRLDIHDLTILKTLRLDGESDTPQSYLTLLLSEALAARVRMAKGLQEPVLPKEHTYGDAPFDGKLLPSSVLFELFADIAVAPTPNTDSIKIAFGDVLEDEKRKGKLLLAISPACDLQRCPLDYEVLLVPGSVVESNVNLSTLINNSYGFGQGGLVLKLPNVDGEISYSNIAFEYKSLKTMPASVLQDGKQYRRIARLTEIFAQEIKTLALNNVARVGVPIDPSFSIGLKVKVRYRFTGDEKGAQSVDGDFDADGAEFLPAVLAMGRQLGDSNLNRTVMFSLQFKEQLQKMLADKLAQQQSNKLKAVADHFAKAESYKIVFEGDGDSKSFNGGIVVKYSRALGPLGQAKGFEIHLYSEIEEDKPADEADS